MPYCPHCGALVAEDTVNCRNCGTSIQLQQPSSSQSPQSTQTAPIPSVPQYPPAGSSKKSSRYFATLGVVSAILSLFVAPQVFGSAAIILGAYVWRREQGNRGICIVVSGIISMLVGLFFTV